MKSQNPVVYKKKDKDEAWRKLLVAENPEKKYNEIIFFKIHPWTVISVFSLCKKNLHTACFTLQYTSKLQSLDVQYRNM
jgi:hypothetical protein